MSIQIHHTVHIYLDDRNRPHNTTWRHLHTTAVTQSRPAATLSFSYLELSPR
jgi:hypothetical protein